MRVLLKDPIFRKMMLRVPQLPDNVLLPSLSPPWQVWVMKTDGNWQRARKRTYRDAFDLLKLKLKDEHVEDVSIVSIRYLMPPPVGYRWQWHKYPWCPRCRRPSMFVEEYDHRAIPPTADITYDDPIRCFYCGIREAAFPRYSPR